MDKLQLDPLMFEMPLDTCIEICDTQDVGLALVNALHTPNIAQRIFHISGGPTCRTTFGEYLTEMFTIFGLGTTGIPAIAFSQNDFHCGWMDTTRSQNLFHYQRTSLGSYYNAVRKKIRGKNWLIRLVRPIALRIVLNRSPYYRILPRKVRKPQIGLSIKQYLRKLRRTTVEIKKKIRIS